VDTDGLDEPKSTYVLSALCLCDPATVSMARASLGLDWWEGGRATALALCFQIQLSDYIGFPGLGFPWCLSNKPGFGARPAGTTAYPRPGKAIEWPGGVCNKVRPGAVKTLSKHLKVIKIIPENVTEPLLV